MKKLIILISLLILLSCEEVVWEDCRFIRGVTLLSRTKDGFLNESVVMTLEKLRDLGVESIIIVFDYYIDDQKIFPTKSTASDESIINAIKLVKNMGMRVALKPHINPIDGTWRGDMSFRWEDEWNTFFINYQDFILRYAEIAEKYHLDLFVIGTELAETVSRSEWKTIIDNIRKKFRGSLTYASHHAMYKKIEWWDKLDYIGVDCYFSLSDNVNPRPKNIQDNWIKIIEKMRSFAEAKRKKILITEVGFQSREGTSIIPWYDEKKMKNMKDDQNEQALCYETILKNCDYKFLGGLYWWQCYYDSEKDPDKYGFIGKEAEKVIFKNWKKK